MKFSGYLPWNLSKSSIDCWVNCRPMTDSTLSGMEYDCGQEVSDFNDNYDVQVDNNDNSEGAGDKITHETPELGGFGCNSLGSYLEKKLLGLGLIILVRWNFCYVALV